MSDFGQFGYKCFIPTNTSQYALLDANGGLRATAFSLESILTAKRYYGWGTIHTINFKQMVTINKKTKKQTRQTIMVIGPKVREC